MGISRKSEVRSADASGPDVAQTADVPNEVRADDDHVTVEPTEADYEKARTVGIGNEPELPPGKVENGATARAKAL